MRGEPQARGRCHDADYVGDTELPAILVADVGGSNAVAVPDESAGLVRAAEDASPDLAPPTTAPGARPAGVRLFLQGYFHPNSLGLVGKQEAHAPCRPLVNLLIVFGANIVALSDIAHVADDECSHACLLQRGDKARGLLVLDCFDLLFDLLELFLLGTDDALAPFAAARHFAIDAWIEFGLQLVAVLHFGTQEPSIENVGRLAIMRDRHMYFAEIDACNLARRERAVRRRLLVGRDGLILRSRPVDNDCVRERPGPGEHKRDIALPIGEAQLPLFERHRAPLVLNAEVPFAFVRGAGVVILLAPHSPTLQTCKEGLHAGIGGVGMQFVGGVPAHEVRRPQPDALVFDSTPERDERLGIKPPAFLCEFIQLRGFADTYAAYKIVFHKYGFFLSAPKMVMRSRTRAQADMDRTAHSKETAVCFRLKHLSCNMGYQIQCTFSVFLNHSTLEELWVVLNL
jgi:hypothetical protein